MEDEKLNYHRERATEDEDESEKDKSAKSDEST